MSAAPPRPARPATGGCPNPDGRNFTCTHCGFTGHRDLVGGANIARRNPGGPITTTQHQFPVVITHRRAGRHLPGAGQSA